MARKLSAFLALIMIVLTASPATGGAGVVVAQAGDEPTSATPAAQRLAAGEVYEGFGYEMVAAGALVEPSHGPRAFPRSASVLRSATQALW